MTDSPNWPANWRWHWLWDVYFGIGCMVGVVAAATRAGTTEPQRLFAAAALTGILFWYLFFGRRLIAARDEGHRATAFVGGLIVLFAGSIYVIPTNSIVMFALYPMIFMAVPLGRALPAIVVISLTPAALVALTEGPSSPDLHRVLVIPLFGMVFSALIGTWIVRLHNESEDRAALIERLEASRAEVAKLSHEAGISAERSRLAREIHDTLAQGFTSIVTLVQATESELDRAGLAEDAKVRKHLALAAKTARENLTEARVMVAELTPSALDVGTLCEAVRRQADRLGEETGITASFAAEGVEGDLPTAVEVVLLRAAQEALSNVRKHAGADSVAVGLRFTDAAIRLSVADDGYGFDPAEEGEDGDDAGFGLRGMRARVEQVAGQLMINSRPGSGTTLTLEVPR